MVDLSDHFNLFWDVDVSVDKFVYPSIQENYDHQSLSAVSPFRANALQTNLRLTNTFTTKDHITLEIWHNSVFANILFAKFER